MYFAYFFFKTEKILFHRIPFETLELKNDVSGDGLINKIKKYAICFFEFTNGDIYASNMNLEVYQVALQYTDTDGDDIQIRTDRCVVQTLKELTPAGKEVKILAKVTKKKE